MKPACLPILPIVLAAALSTANAALVASYNFDGSPTGLSSDSDANSTAGNFGVGAGINGGTLRISTFTAISGANSASMLSNEISRNEADAITNNDYWTFTVTATSGALNLDQLVFRYGSSRTEIPQASIFIRSSIDNFTGNIAFSDASTTLNYRAPEATAPGAWMPDAAVVPFSSLGAYQNLSNITFRIYGYDNAGHASAAGIRIENVQLTTIPEPSSIFAAALLPILSLMRKRRH
ncbi:MAG TPA: hypothetical protein VM511_06320 [Luteolibacter sp.]|nr:hypothetical protein [Luteolibacter sp.]